MMLRKTSSNQTKPRTPIVAACPSRKGKRQQRGMDDACKTNDWTTIADRARGFSLLELMIVLVIMAGMLAVVWPNLSKPLESSAVREAAQVVRDAIDHARYEAAMDGEIQFVQFRKEGGELSSGTFSSFLSDADLSSGAGLGSEASNFSLRPIVSDLSRDNGLPRRPRVWKLPTDVILLDVQWTSTPYLPPEADPINADRSEGPKSADQLRRRGSMGPATGSQENLTDGNFPVWWLPFSPLGGGKDASIFLFDQRTRKTVSVRYESATGSLEIVRE